jgi:hypothetical protein
MSFKEFFYGSSDEEDSKSKIDKTKPLILVSREESLHEMFKNLFPENRDDSSSCNITTSLGCEDFNNSSEVVQKHLGFNGMLSQYKKAKATLEKDRESLSICVERRKNRVMFAYNMDTQECVSSIQTKYRNKWEHMGVLEKRYDDLYSIVLAVEKYDLINRGGSL